MKNLRKQWKLAIVLIVAVVVAQAAVSVAVRTRRMHGFLVEQLERSFGRPVEVDYFSVRLLPMPELDAQQVTIGEDPAFGNEYFLRAEHLGASLRWSGLLRGHFEFGTVSLDRPSLILARNQEGKWNLERWLPPEKETAGKTAHFYGPQPAATRGNYLRKINVDEGRINFKIGDEKLPFAFTGVTGSVEQIAFGRWQLQLEAQPWRSGVQLQSTGIMRVVGDIAGTSARLRPAEINVRWDKVSLADLFRMVSGADLGVRGEFALDATAKSGPAADVANTAAGTPQDWTFALAARGTRIHRWNLTDRDDNPSVNVSMNGRWNSALGTVFAKEVKVETVKSNLRGTAEFLDAPAPSWKWEVDSAGIQAADLLAWYRAFHGGVAEGVSAEQFFTGTMRVSGWPVVLQSAAFSSTGGALKIPGLERSLHIGAMRGGKEKEKFTVEPVAITMAGKGAPTQSAKRRTSISGSENGMELAMTGDLAAHAGAVTVTGRVEEIADTLKITAALGQTLNHGWELKGAAAAAMRWEWNALGAPGQWTGAVTLTGAELEAAGLNLPVRMEDVRLEWNGGKRGATIGKVGLLGANWSGEIAETRLLAGNEAPRWNFKLHADHLNATELDRWIGPRARPGWLSNLLPSLLRDAAPKAMPTDLLRRVDAEGEMRVDDVTIERLKLVNLQAQIAMRDLRLDVKEAEAQWAGGTVRGKLLGVFAPAPKYEIAVELEGVDLAQIPAGRLSDDFAGSGFATLQLSMEGVGREQLLQKLAGKGKVRLKNPEFHGWNVSAKESAPRSGISRWTSGEGSFSVGERSVKLDGLQLESASGQTTIRGTVSFAREANLRIETKASGTNGARPAAAGAVKISGPLEGPKVTYENLQAKKSAD
jgi:uncharacterized protein involved in outer membrane biogenesis